MFQAMKLTVNELLLEVLETMMPGARIWALEFIAGGGGGFSQVGCTCLWVTLCKVLRFAHNTCFYICCWKLQLPPLTYYQKSGLLNNFRMFMCTVGLVTANVQISTSLVHST